MNLFAANVENMVSSL